MSEKTPRGEHCSSTRHLPDWETRHKFPQRLCIGTSFPPSCSSAHRLAAAAFAFSCPWSSLRWSLFYCGCFSVGSFPRGAVSVDRKRCRWNFQVHDISRHRLREWLGRRPRVLAQLGCYSAGMEDASTSGLVRQLGALEVSDSPCTMGELSNDSDYLTATARDADPETEATSYFSAVEVEEQIEQSKVHWSLLSLESRGSEEGEEEEVAEVSNARVFKVLQAHPSWVFFFRREDQWVEFVVGKKFAAGAQAELYHVRVTGRTPEWNEENRKMGREWVVKVFRKGTFLRDLQLQVPTGYLDYRAQLRNMDATLLLRFQSDVRCGILLADGRFAFLMGKEHFDLRYVIECNMKSRGREGRGPFSKEEVELIMYQVAVGMDWLHSHNIVHRDLKASNVLVTEFKSTTPKYMCYVADFECSVGVIGTGFFRAPEILQACKDGKLEERPKLFSKAADVYGYGMVCYEALTGKLPFEGHRASDYDLVLNGERPMVPKYVEGWTCELLNGCWQSNPRDRPSFGEILDLLIANSRRVRAREEYSKAYWGKDFRAWGHIENRSLRMYQLRHMCRPYP